MEIVLDDIQDTLFLLRQKSAQHAERQRDFLMYGGSSCRPEVKAHLQALEMVRDQMIAGALCICDAEVEAIYYGARTYLGPNCAPPVPDYTMTERPGAVRWVLENPECVLYEHWFDLVRAQSRRVGIDLKVKERECAAVGLDIRVAYQEACKVIIRELEVEELNCELGLNITAEYLDKCKVDFETRVEPLNCGLSLSTYVKALNCGLDLETIVREVECGATVRVTAETVELCMPDEEISDID